MKPKKKYDHLKIISQNAINALKNNEITQEEVFDIIAKIKEELNEIDEKNNNNELNTIIRSFLN
ncbi:hypothetical protein [Flavobacterium sp. GCM10023249]|uniref:hypothetical protein n=1 Tax=unclassified Flavobacterium TaxID=196869 RepID=UPI00361BEA4E